MDQSYCRSCQYCGGVTASHFWSHCSKSLTYCKLAPERGWTWLHRSGVCLHRRCRGPHEVCQVSSSCYFACSIIWKQSHNCLDVVLGLYQGKHKYNVSFTNFVCMSCVLMVCCWEVVQLAEWTIKLWAEIGCHYFYHAVRKARPPISWWQLFPEGPLVFWPWEHTLNMIMNWAESLHCQSSTDPRYLDGIMPPNLESVIDFMCNFTRASNNSIIYL